MDGNIMIFLSRIYLIKIIIEFVIEFIIEIKLTFFFYIYNDMKTEILSHFL